jgi:isopenicillin-N N-acyltransferase-like protein
MTTIEIEGQAYERGRQYGARAALGIRHNVEAYLQLIEFYSGLDRRATWQATAAFGPILEAYAPELLEEMRGIAEGADCGLQEIVLINARSELMATMSESGRRATEGNGCTALAATPEVTAQGRVLLAQNWDWYTAVEPEPVLLRIRQPGKPEILTLCEAGQVGKIGMNSAGLGVCLNFLEHRHARPDRGLPIHIILRQILDCAHLGDAIHRALQPPRGGAANILLAHAEGEILDLELTASDADFIYGDAGWLVHANHFESPRLKGGDTGLATSMSTLARAARAHRLLGTAAGQQMVDLDTIQTILGDHTYGPYAICRHPAPGEPPLQQTATRASAIMDLRAGEMHLALGQPCRAEYQTLAFSQ